MTLYDATNICKCSCLVKKAALVNENFDTVISMSTDYINTSIHEKRVNQSVGIRQYMSAVYSYMSLALACTAFVAMVAANSREFMYTVHGSPLRWIVMIAPLVMVFYIGKNLFTMSHSGVQISLFVFASLMGLSLSSIFLVFTGESISHVFLITSLTFSAMSFYAKNTSRDLSPLGSFLGIGLIGLFILSTANLFFGSMGIHFLCSLFGVIVFALLTAYDTQKIREIYYQYNGHSISRLAVYGALTLYMDFINLFMYLISIIGIRRDD